MIVRDYKDVEAQGSPEAEGVTLRWVVAKEDGAPHFAMRVIDVEVGKSTPLHEHWWEHEVYVLSGTGIVRNGESEHSLKEGSVVFVAGDEKHQFRNTGADVLRFICMVPHTD